MGAIAYDVASDADVTVVEAPTFEVDTVVGVVTVKGDISVVVVDVAVAGVVVDISWQLTLSGQCFRRE